MKKKFVLTMALVLIVAATVVAAPVELSGEFKAGYKLGFDPTNVAVANLDGKFSAKTAKISVTGDFWKVTLDTVNFTNKKDITAKADIYLDKALGEQGVDMGDIGLTLHVGNGVSKKVLSVFADKGDFSSELAMTAANNAGLTFKYADLVTVYASVDPTISTPPMVVGVKVNPVDGVSVAGGYSSNAKGISGSAKVDVAALAGLDFDLAVSMEDIYLLDAKTNELNLDVATKIEGIGLWAAYQMDAGKKHNVGVGASYEISGVGLSASVEMIDLANTLTTTIDAGANYKMGGVKYALDVKYVVDPSAFSLTPSVTIAF